MTFIVYFCEECIGRRNTDDLVWLIAMCALMHSLETLTTNTHSQCMLYKGVRSCPTKTYYTLIHCKINSNQLYLSLYMYVCKQTQITCWVDSSAMLVILFVPLLVCMCIRLSNEVG